MKKEIIVNEQFSPLWKIAAIVSSTIAVLFFIIFLITAEPLWEGIFRFVAFIGFIGAVFSLLRLREGQKKIQIEFLDEQLRITYYKKEDLLKEELFERKTIKEIYKKEVKSFAWLPISQKEYEFFISFTDTENVLGLFDYSGRNLRFAGEAADKIDRFIQK